MLKLYSIVKIYEHLAKSPSSPLLNTVLHTVIGNLSGPPALFYNVRFEACTKKKIKNLTHVSLVYLFITLLFAGLIDLQQLYQLNQLKTIYTMCMVNFFLHILIKVPLLS